MDLKNDGGQYPSNTPELMGFSAAFYLKLRQQRQVILVAEWQRNTFHAAFATRCA
jgi:hypothetical protein